MLRILHEAANKALHHLLNVDGALDKELKLLAIAVAVWTSRCSNHRLVVIVANTLSPLLAKQQMCLPCSHTAVLR